MFPDPEILTISEYPVPSTRSSAQIRDATSTEPPNGALPPNPSVDLLRSRAVKPFVDKKLKLADDLPLNDRRKQIISELIEAAGGEIITDVNEADIFVCNYRDGADYVTASQANKDVGNLSWLYYIIAHDTWTNPMRRMMHYPRPRDGIPGFEKYKISISSYTGEARVYLENLVKATGAQFTKTFKQDNTHLITAHTQSEKCEAAKEWGVHVVNHLWLEESYARCKEQTLTDSRYTYFPSRTNLGEILGQTQLDRDAVERNYFSKTLKPKSVKATMQSGDVPASSLPPARVPSDHTARSSPLADKNRRTKSATEMATPARRSEGKENETPSTAGSRGAKDRALSKLHDAAPDIAKFEKEMKRKGGVIHGGRRDKDAEGGEKTKKSKDRESTASKRSIDEVDVEDETTSDEATVQLGKKNKKAKMTPIKYRMLISKDDRWQDNPGQESKDKAKLRELGIFINDDVKRVDLLCAPKIVRTRKFVAALAAAPTLVSSSYLDYALKYNKLPPPDKHLLQDRTFEKHHKFQLSEALDRAQQNKHRLLKDWAIFCTQAVSGGFDTYKDIVEANGGKCLLWDGRTTKISASKRSINAEAEESQNQEEDEGDVLYLISEPKKSEFKLWEKFRELAKKHDMIPRIVKTEWLLFVAMAQFVHWDPEWELNEESLK